MTYDIVTNRGTVDFAADLEIAEKKFRQYERDMKLGYSTTVKIIDRKSNEIVRETYA